MQHFEKRYIQEAEKLGLIPVMNNTKWNEICDLFESGEIFCPLHKTSCLSDYTQNWDYCWKWHFPQFDSIIHVELIPWSSKKIGILVPDEKTDHTQEIVLALKKIGAPFSVESNGHILIHGYIDSSSPPTL